MTFLMGAPIPTTGAGTGSGDWLVGLVTIVGFAIAVGVAMVLGNRASKVEPAVNEEPEEHLRKAA